MSLDNDPHDPAMPYISVTNPTSVYEVLAPQIVTTTIYPSSTASATSTHPHRQVVPIGAIVGGVCAGAAAACIITIAWILWGRSIKRKQLKERQQAVSARSRALVTPAR